MREVHGFGLRPSTTTLHCTTFEQEFQITNHSEVINKQVRLWTLLCCDSNMQHIKNNTAIHRAGVIAEKTASVKQIESSEVISTECECRLLLFYLFSKDGEAFPLQ